MKERIHLYVSRKNVLTWLMTLCLVGSAVTRIVFACLKGSGETQEVWSQIVLPVAATLLYVLIVLIAGKEQFYKTAIPVLLMAFYYAIRPHGLLSEHTVIRGMFYTCLLFYFLIYAYISSGKIRYSWLLFPLFAAPLATLLYSGVRMSDWHAYLIDMHILADILLFVGGVLLVFAIRVHPVGEYHPTWGDRSDGRRIRTEPPMNQVSPYIMVTRNTSTNFFAESFEITGMERYIRQKRREGLTNFGLMHILLAAYCRGLCKFPALNRFIAGQKIYSRGEDVQFCMTIKKEMTSTSPETLIKVHLSPRDTAEEVYNKVNKEIEKVKNTPLDSNFDNTANALTMIPGIFLKFTVWLLKTLDYFGLLPKFLLEVSPFHGSVFFTSMGSLGIPPIYHHLYDFGNLPVFGSFGCKRRTLEVLEDGSVIQRKYMDVKFTLDERICDGYYYAAFFKYYKRLLAHPEVLENPPEEIASDID